MVSSVKNSVSSVSVSDLAHAAGPFRQPSSRFGQFGGTMLQLPAEIAYSKGKFARAITFPRFARAPAWGGVVPGNITTINMPTQASLQHTDPGQLV